MRYYQTKSGYKYKEYKNGEKKRISNEEYKKNVNNITLKGSGTGNSNKNKLIKQLVTLKKKMNKVNELLKRKVNLKELPKNLNNNLNNNLNKAQKLTLLAMIANHKKYKNKNNSSEPLELPYNLVELIASEVSSVDLRIDRLLSQAISYIAMIKGVTVITSDINYTNLETIQNFYNSIIAEHFPQIQGNNLDNSTFRQRTNEMDYKTANAIEKFGPIELWDVSKVTDMSRLFRIKKPRNVEIQIKDIGGWDVSNVTNMQGMFENSEFFNQDIGGWDVSNVTNMESMFLNNKLFNQNIGGWDVSKVTNMQGMFTYTELFNQDISGWNVSKVTNMRWMFAYTKLFNQNIGEWGVSNGADMQEMFADCPIKEEFKCKQND
jgi:surface protein